MSRDNGKTGVYWFYAVIKTIVYDRTVAVRASMDYVLISNCYIDIDSISKHN